MPRYHTIFDARKQPLISYLEISDQYAALCIRRTRTDADGSGRTRTDADGSGRTRTDADGRGHFYKIIFFLFFFAFFFVGIH